MVVAGIMSGTSADAIDVALVEISGRGWNTRYRLLVFHSSKYPPAVRKRILAIAAGEKTDAGEIALLNFVLGELYANACRSACRKAKIPLGKLELIGSHGQTIFHQGQPADYYGFPVASTMQLGEAAVIAERTGVSTVADFRPADIAAGGQGAPLVPFFDYLTYRHPRRGRIALNIGGIANLTAIPAAGGPGDVIAFDTGPGNMLLDALAARISDGALSYDRGGRLAAQGEITEQQVARLLRQDYFRRQPPKSAGREQFGEAYLRKYFLKPFGSSHKAMLHALATATAFTAEAIALAITDFVLPRFPVAECFVSGGGSRNPFLMAQLRHRLRRHVPIEVRKSEAAGVPSAAKEAVAFAVLAYQTYHQQSANVPAATGAKHPVILGKIAYAGR